MEFERTPISETWRAMEDLVKSGLVRNIGVSNFGTSLLRDLLSYARIPPAVLQVEMHPYLTQEKLLRYCSEQNIAVTAFSPLGALSYLSSGMAYQSESIIQDPTVLEIAANHSRTTAQIVLRWGLQRGTAIITRTTNPTHLDENISLFDFQLAPDEMSAISYLNRDRRFNDPGVFCEDAFNTFCPIYE
jgi:D-xylose reductase